jgi:hypothetical protein
LIQKLEALVKENIGEWGEISASGTVDSSISAVSETCFIKVGVGVGAQLHTWNYSALWF